MDSLITLGIGRMEIDWGKHNIYKDHSVLFKPSDIKQIPYYYFDADTEKPLFEMKEGCARRLSTMKMRLDLMGYDMPSVKRIYRSDISLFTKHGTQMLPDFDTFYNTIKKIDITGIDTVKFESEWDENGFDFGEYARKCILEHPQIRDRLLAESSGDNTNTRRSLYDLSEFLENLDPYVTLRILAENPANSDYEVQWNFANIVESGLVERADIINATVSKDKLMIVTEGKSDTNILQKVIGELYPDISDFFDFIDMKENYPFTGVGNLYNFCMGLCRINIRNKVMIIFDNDTAGVEIYDKTLALNNPDNLLITKLPFYPDFSCFQTIGPQGASCEDINGKAVAIECFLDFSSVHEVPCARWTSYNSAKKQYQGELENKKAYTLAFMHSNLSDGSYNTKKLKFLIEFLIAQWINRKTD